MAAVVPCRGPWGHCGHTVRRGGLSIECAREHGPLESTPAHRAATESYCACHTFAHETNQCVRFLHALWSGRPAGAISAAARAYTGPQAAVRSAPIPLS